MSFCLQDYCSSTARADALAATAAATVSLVTWCTGHK